MLSETASRADVDSRRVWEDTRDDLAELISRHGRAPYAAHDRIAQQRIGEAVRRADLPALRQLAAEYPSAAALPTALQETARLLARSGDLQASLALWRELLSASTPRESRQSALVGLAETLEQENCVLSAAEVWRPLARDFPNAPLGADRRPAIEAVPHKLSLPPYAEELRHVESGEPVRPLQRAWDVALDEGTGVVVLTGTPPGLEWESALLHTPGLKCVDAATGRVRWERPWSRPVTWAGYGMAHLLVASDRELSALDLETGSTLWTWEVGDDKTSAAVRWQPVAGHVFAGTDAGVTCLDADTGRALWEFAPPGGLHPRWFADERSVVVLQQSPRRRVVLDAVTGRVRSDVPEPGQPWRGDPVRVGPDRFAVVDADRRVRAFGAGESARPDLWTYDGPGSHVHAEPVLLAADGVVLLIVDGFSVSRLSPDDGAVLWSQPVGWPPLTDPLRQIALDGEHLWCAPGGQLRAFGLDDGVLVWERLLDGTEACRVARRGRRLAVLRSKSALLCDAATGQPLQLLPSDGGRWEATATPRLLTVATATLTCWK
jgi:outer membrane protein assembly factor BamB